MSEIQTLFIDGTGDWLLAGASLAVDDGLESAIVISLFTDRRANEDDLIPGGTDRRGWWGDTFSEVEGDKIGSRLWLLSREKQEREVLERAKQYSEEALAWLVEDGIARAITVTASIVRDGLLGLQIEVARSGRSVSKYRFESFWKGQ